MLKSLKSFKRAKKIHGVSMTEETTQKVHDTEERKKSYEGIMGAATEVGVPAALGLTMFFTSLVMANGFVLSILLGAAVYVFAHIIVKVFFSHH